MIEDDETLQMYIEESLEHLSDIESDLLAIEEGGKDIDIDLVNNVFRAAHSIKGGAGFMGLTTIKDLGHSLENVLDLIRNMELVPDSDVISVLLKGFDKLENLMNNIATSNEEDVSEHLTALKNITEQPAVEEQEVFVEDSKEDSKERFDICLSDGRIFPQVSPYDIEQCRNEGKFIFIAEYELIRDLQQKNKNPLDFFASLEKTGTILDARIGVQSIGTLSETTLPVEMPLQLLYASILEPDMAGTLFDLEDEYIHVISEDMIQLSEMPELSEPSLMPAQDKAKEPEIAVSTVSARETAVESVTAPSSPAVKEEKTPPVKIVESTEKGTKAAISVTKPQGSLRINVNLLDTLMNLAGELVLSRNQLLQSITSSNTKATELSSQHIDMITSELQEAIMRTRMQPIAVVLTKFTRVVRDLSKKVGKTIDLEIEGKDVELDKTIIESINDPLTHLVRNSVDHGIELPEDRKKAGKNATGKIVLKAFHDAGQVNIVISDDGKGLDPDRIALTAVNKGLMTEQQVDKLSDKEKTELILLPGFSTAEKVTDISGRGVGMDVVMTNIEKLGGLLEINSTLGKGTDIQIKLPLTLAIIPSQIISLDNEKYAIPQVNLDELLRIPASQIKERIEKVGNAEVVRLRGNLLPLLDLGKVLGINKKFVHPEEKAEYTDRRKSIADRRSTCHIISEDGEEVVERSEIACESEKNSQRSDSDRRYHAASAINIAVVSAGSFKYGLVVDELCDSEEIVVKPLGRHLKQCSGYAGATIMGDGKVALILDVSSLAQMAGLTNMAEVERMAQAVKAAEKARESAKDKISLLVFKNGESEYFAAPLNLVERIERIQTSTIEEISDRKVIQYRDGTLPLYELSQVTKIDPLPERDQQEVIVFTVKNRELGLMVTPPIDAVEVALEIDDSTLKMPCISGSMIIDKHTTLLVDIFELVKQLNPDWFEEEKNAVTQMEDDGQKVILFAEDSAFFRNQVKKFMIEEGYQVIVAEDGAIAWELLKERSDEIDIVVTDLEMPNMDGFELTEKIKNDPKFSHFTVIALTSLASDAHIAKGKKVGIDSYEIKLDRENLMKVIRQYLNL